METAVAEDRGRRRPIALVDGQIRHTDQDRRLVGGGIPRIPTNPGEERGVDSLNLVPHLTDARRPRTRKLEEQEGHEMACPALVDPVRDHLCVTLHEVTVDWIYVWTTLIDGFDGRCW